MVLQVVLRYHWTRRSYRFALPVTGGHQTTADGQCVLPPAEVKGICKDVWGICGSASNRNCGKFREGLHLTKPERIGQYPQSGNRPGVSKHRLVPKSTTLHIVLFTVIYLLYDISNSTVSIRSHQVLPHRMECYQIKCCCFAEVKIPGSQLVSSLVWVQRGPSPVLGISS